MLSLSNRIIFDVSSKLSCVSLNTTSYVSRASISTGKILEVQDPGIPKRPLSGYMRFSNEMRPEISKNNPNLRIGEISKIIAQQYKELPVGRKEVSSQDNQCPYVVSTFSTSAYCKSLGFSSAGSSSFAPQVVVWSFFFLLKSLQVCMYYFSVVNFPKIENLKK